MSEEEEVFALEGESAESDQDNDEALLEKLNQYTNQNSDDSQSDVSQEEEMGGWGTKRRVYYEGDDVSDDEDAGLIFYSFIKVRMFFSN